MKYHGIVGFWLDDVEIAPGIYKPGIVERKYYWEISRNGRRWREQNSSNDEFRIENTVSILSDLFARKYFASIRYVIWNDAKLKVTNVTVDYPRITLEIGGFYDGTTAGVGEPEEETPIETP